MEAQSKCHQKSIKEDKILEDRFLQFKQEKDRLQEVKIAQMLFAAMQSNQHSTQPPTLDPPRGNKFPFYTQHMYKLSPITPIGKNCYSTPKEQPASVSS